MSRDAKVKISAFCNIPTSELLTNSYACQHQIATETTQQLEIGGKQQYTITLLQTLIIVESTTLVYQVYHGCAPYWYLQYVLRLNGESDHRHQSELMVLTITSCVLSLFLPCGSSSLGSCKIMFSCNLAHEI